MNVITETSKLQQRILTTLVNKGQIQIRDLAYFLDLSSNQVRVQVRKLEKIGFVIIKAKTDCRAPLEICLSTAINIEKAKPNFDKWIYSGRWV